MKTIEESLAYFRDSYVPFSEAKVSIASAPVLYGLSVYTVFPVFWNDQQNKLYMFRLPDHFKRLQNSARILHFTDFTENWDYERFEKAMRELLVKNEVKQDSLVRVSVFVDDILKGTRMKGLKHDLSAFVYPAFQMLPAEGAHFCVSSWQRVADNAIPARAKINGSYVNSALMKHEAVLNGFDDAISLDSHGHVTESTVSNLFLVRDGMLITPSSSTDLLEGITRDSVFKMAEVLKVPVEQRPIDRSELYLADEMFVCGSSMNITPVISVDRRGIGDGKPGPISQKLAKVYQDVGLGKDKRFSDWSMPV